MGHVDDHVPVAQLGMREHLVEGVDRSANDVQAIEAVEPVLRGVLGQNGFEPVDQRRAIAHPGGIGAEPLLGGELADPGGLAEALELGVIGDRDHDVTVGRLEHLVGDDVRVGVAEPRRELAGDQVVHPLIGEPRDLGVQQPEIDVLALAGHRLMAGGGEDRDRGVHPRHDVGDRSADFLGLASRLAGHAHDPAHGLGDDVVPGPGSVRPGLAEAGERAVYQLGEVGFEVLIGKAVFGEGADPEILHQNVAVGDEPPRQVLAVPLRQVDGDGALVAVRAQIIGAFGRIVAGGVLEEGRSELARVVADPRTLDLDDFRAQIAEQLGAGRSGHDAGQIENAQTAQGTGHRLPYPFRWATSPRSGRGAGETLAESRTICPPAKRGLGPAGRPANTPAPGLISQPPDGIFAAEESRTTKRRGPRSIISPKSRSHRHRDLGRRGR